MSSTRSAALLTACVAVLCAHQAVAQQPATTPVAVEVPQSTCKEPGFAPLDRNSPDMGRFQKRFEEYKVCVQAYAAANQAKANEYETQARAYSDAANKTIDAYNAYVNNLNDSNKSTKSGTPKN